MQRPLKRLLAAAALAVLGVSLVFIGTPLRRSGVPTAEASSHREAPMITSDPRADTTDVYAFVSPDRPDTVTLIANWIPLQEPSNGPNFYSFDDNALYEIKVDNSGDGVEDLSLQFRFTTQVRNPNTFLYNTGQITSLDDTDWNVRQFMNATAMVRQGNTFTTFNLGTNLPTPPVNIGPRSTPNYEALAAAAINVIPVSGSNIRLFAGQRDDSFFIDIGSGFDLLGLRPFNAAHLIPLTNSAGVDFLAGYNVHSIAVQIPINLVTRTGRVATSSTDPAAVIGVWATTSRQTMTVLASDASGGVTRSGNFVQVSRLGMPLVNELVIPLGTSQPGVIAGTKDRFNASSPQNDAQFASFVADPEPARLIDLLYPSVSVPPAPRNDMVAIFATGIAAGSVPGAPTYTTFLSDGQPHEMLRLNTAIPPAATPNRLGLLGNDTAGFPNGRRVGDDVTDIELRVLAGGTPFTPTFNISPNNILGDGVNENDRPYLTAFPYVATPTSGYENSFHGRTGTTDTTTSGSGTPTATPTPRP